MVENGTTACKWDVVIPFAPLWEAYRRIVKPNGAIALFGSQPFTSALVMSNPKMFRYELIWDKVNRYTGHLSSAKIPLKRHENIVIFYSASPVFNKQFRDGSAFPVRSIQGNQGAHLGVLTNSRQKFRTRCGNDGTQHNPCSIIPFKGKVNSEIGLHPTQKPVALLEYLIRTYTNEGDTVLDSCMGSGSTGIACMRTDRKFIGIEKDPHYFQVACQRVKDEQRQEGLFTI